MGKFVVTADGKRSREEGTKVSAMIQQLGRLTSGERVARVQLGLAASQPQPVADLKPIEAASPVLEVADRRTCEPTSSPTRRPADSPSPPPPERPALAETIRISTAKLDRLLLEAEEMLTVKQTAAQRAADLRQFEVLFEQWTKQWAKVQAQVRELRNAPALPPDHKVGTPVQGHKPSPEPARPLAPLHSGLLEFLDWNFGYIKSLEGKLRALGKSAAQDQHVIGKLVDDLLADSKKLLMLPFSTLSDLFPKLVRDLSRDQGKEADLVVRGSEVEMDKRILEEMKDPLIHLVRNCIDQGIEKPEERPRQNKPPRATITIAVAQVNGNKVQILVSDDGAGIDLARVKESAVKRGIISAEEAQQIDDQTALDLIFQSEVSTSPMITEISGRGLGLAIVREKTEKLGGRVFVESRHQVGTAFRIVLPLTLATFRGILVRVADQVFVIPTAHVERVARIKSAEVKTVENRETISLNGRAVSFVRLENVLEMARSDQKTQASDFIPVVVLGSGDERIAFGVDDVLHDEDVLVKSLAKPLARVRNVAGATVLASGKVVPILNVADLMKSARKVSGTSRAARVTAAAAKGEPKTKTILLAEDSITSRMLLKGILESAGYQVKTAVDGVEAWTALRTEDFDLVVSDIEMPRMNGFDLTAHIRSDKKLADKPVVLVTALSSPADREHGIDVGANAYIVKSSFDQSNLLEVVRRIIG